MSLPELVLYIATPCMHVLISTRHESYGRMTIPISHVSLVQTLEYVCEEYGGRVKLAKDYYDGLTRSLIKNFKGTGIISSMQQCNDFFFLGTSQISFGRAGQYPIFSSIACRLNALFLSCSVKICSYTLIHALSIHNSSLVRF